MEVTEEMWEMLMGKFDSMEKKLDKLNGIRIWKAKVTGALTIMTVVLIPVLLTIVRLWLTK